MHIVVMNIVFCSPFFLFVCFLASDYNTFSKSYSGQIYPLGNEYQSIWKKYWIILLLCTKGLGHFVV